MRHLHTWKMVSAFGIALALSACGDDGGTDDTTTTNGTTDGTATGTSTTTTTTTTTDGTTTTTTDMTTTDMTTGMTTDMTTGVDTGTGTGGGDVCEPEQDDDECTLCTKENCCDQLTACFTNPDCACVVTCVGEAGGGLDAIPGCLMECDVEALPAEASPLQQCNTENCSDVCG